MIEKKKMNGKTKVDVAVLQEQVREIKDNHLVHMNDRLDKIERRLETISDRLTSMEKNIAKGAGGVAVVVIVVQFVLTRFF